MNTILREAEREEFFLKIVADIVTAYARNNPLTAMQLNTMIVEVFNLLQKLTLSNATSNKPAVAPEESVFDEYIICLEDGKKYKSLKRHLMAAYGLTAEAYRLKWNLPPDYPMVAKNYAKRRSYLAKKIALGTRKSSRRSHKNLIPTRKTS